MPDEHHKFPQETRILFKLILWFHAPSLALSGFASAENIFDLSPNDQNCL
jgi:hypothetical protein